MTNEEKQDIAAECRRLIAEASKEGAGYRTVAKGKVAEIALAALTAQPVKLPNKIERDDADGYWMHKSGRVSAVNAAYFNEALSECKEALNAQGYEVQE